MGEYLPFLFAIAYVVYGFYNNFKKGQEEARKRNPSQPWEGEQDRGKQKPQRSTPSQGKSLQGKPVKPTYTTAEPILVKEVYDPAHPEPKYESVYQQPAYAEYEKPKTAPKKKSAIPTSVSISDRISHHDEEPAYAFDIRDAVVKKAILDRPQY